MTRETHLYRVIFQETRVIKPRSRRFARDRYRFIKHRNDTLKMELVELTRAFSFLSSLFPFFRPSMKRGEFPCMINACKFLNGKKSELENLREIRHDKVTLNLVKIPSLPFTARLVYFGLFLYFFFFFLFGNRIVGYIGVVKCKLLHNGRQKINVHGSPLRFSGFNGWRTIRRKVDRFASRSVSPLSLRC